MACLGPRAVILHAPTPINLNRDEMQRSASRCFEPISALLSTNVMGILAE